MKKNEGSIVVVSLVIATAALLLLGVFLGSIVVERKNNQRSYHATQALNLAEAGIEEAIWKLHHQISGDSGKVNIPGVGDFEYTSTALEDTVTIEASGYAPGINVAGRVVRRVEVTMERDLYDVFDYALFADKGGIDLIENVYVDSYDSRLGSYEDQATHDVDEDEDLHILYALSSATIGTNSISPGTVSLTDNAHIFGDAMVGPGGDPSVAISITDNAKITGSKEAINSEVELPEVIPPSHIDHDYSGTPEAHLKVHNVVEFNNPGVYKYDSISVSGNGKIMINADVVFYVESDVQIEVDVTGNGVIEIATGCSATFYVGGNMKVAGNGILNNNKDPTTLAIYGTDQCEEINFVGNADFYGVVYARRAEIDVVGNGRVYGALLGNKIYISGNGTVHYDEALKDSDESFPSWARHYEVALWQEK